MWKVNNRGRIFHSGKSLCIDTRQKIVDEILDSGGDPVTGVFYGFVNVAKKFEVSNAVVSKIWRQYCTSNDLNQKHGGGNRHTLSEGDLQLIEVLKRQRPSITYSEIMDCLNEFGDLPEGTTSAASVCKAVRYKLPSGAFTFKKNTYVAQERFTINNMAYTQLFVDYLHQKDPYSLKYFDECSVKLPSASSRNYGHAPRGERVVEIKRYCQTANLTVNLMCGLAGITYVNTLDGPSDTVKFLCFFEEAYNSINPNTGLPCLEIGDTIVMDNCPLHHNQGGAILRDFLNDLNIELVYMPAYSPDFNPAEYVFGKMKAAMKYKLWNLTSTDLITAIYTAINSITLNDLREFYKITGYLEL